MTLIHCPLPPEIGRYKGTAEVHFNFASTCIHNYTTSQAFFIQKQFILDLIFQNDVYKTHNNNKEEAL
ncbi:MAG: hypothetical protein Q4F38_05800, partial [Akkermansia sp.]|nr:hypothetical protein [Akkermansia sp.]